MIWKCNNCNIEQEVEGLQPPIFCPNCGQKNMLSGNSIQNDKDGLLPQTAIAPLQESKSKRLICPICCSEIIQQDEQTICPHCNVCYHKECWDDNQGCATYGCPAAPEHSGHEDVNRTVEWQPCPWCHTLLPGKMVICSTCGHRTDELPAGAQFKENLKKDLKHGLLTIRSKTLLLWNECMPYLLYLLRMYKRSILLYASFSGEDTRKEFTSFAFATLIIILILSVFSGNAILICLYCLGTLLPTAASIVRRLRNAGLSPWYCFAVPVLLLLLFVPTEHNESKSNNT